jgi:hypothetical protein
VALSGTTERRALPVAFMTRAKQQIPRARDKALGITSGYLFRAKLFPCIHERVLIGGNRDLIDDDCHHEATVDAKCPEDAQWQTFQLEHRGTPR